MRTGMILFLLGMLLGCEKGLVKNKNFGEALGTTYSITYLSEKKMDIQREIDSVFQNINQSLSTYISDSDISRINNGDTTVVVDQSFRDVYFNSQVVNYETDGYFDPTVGVLVDAWGFGPGKQINALDSTQVDSLMQYVGWIKVGLNKDFTITKTKPEIRFDFNAIAKGYTIDRLGRMLDKKGVNQYLVELGGEVLAKGTNRISERPWTVGVDDPNNPEARGSAAVLRLEDRALASSGNYRKFWIDPDTGEKFVHTINPKTGYTKNSNVLSATVITKYCIEADAYATAFMAMDLQQSKELLERRSDLEAFIIYVDEQGEVQRFITDGFQELLLN